MGKLWKAAERKIAALLGGRRVPITGRTRGDSPDIEHERYSIEVKHRESLPEWLMDAFAQADSAGKKDSKTPPLSLVILHQKGQKYEDSLALMRVRDIMALEKTIANLELENEALMDEVRLACLQ